MYLGGRDIRMAGSVSVKPGAESFRVPVRNDDLGQGAQCLPPGVPGATMSPFPLQIVHKPDVMVILYEAYNIFRIVPIGRGHSEDIDPTWLGNSVGHWEGDTLVLDVIGFNDKTLVSGSAPEVPQVVSAPCATRSAASPTRRPSKSERMWFSRPRVKYAGNLVLHPGSGKSASTSAPRTPGLSRAVRVATRP